MKRLSLLCIVCILILTTPSLVLAVKTHRVKKNDTLYSLAKKYNVSVTDLKSANNLISTRLKNGERLVIPSQNAGTASTVVKTGTAPKQTSYRVKKGDTLTKISRKTGVSVADIKRLNDLPAMKLKRGRTLVLCDDVVTEEPHKKVTRHNSFRFKELFDDADDEQGLAELIAPELQENVDLSKTVGLNVDNIKRLKKTAYGFLGTRYRFGGSSRRGLDCSSFVQQVFRDMRIALPRTAREQFVVGNEVLPGDLQKGDLVFFRTYASFPSHVGIYLGDNKMIHASSRDRRVVISTMNTSYYRARYIGAKRIAKINPDTLKLDELLTVFEEENPDDMETNDTLGLNMEK